MNDIICPHCHKAFKIDDAGYADILKQVRDSDFDRQLHERLALAEQDKRNAIELLKARVAGEMQKAAAAKDVEIHELKARLDAGDMERRLAVAEALGAVEKQRDALAGELDQARHDKQNALKLAEARLANELQRAAAAKDTEILQLKSRLESAETARRLAVAEALGGVEKERDELRSSLERAQLERRLGEQSLKERYETQVKDRDDAIERLRDMKARLSTKMVGETLEQHASSCCVGATGLRRPFLNSSPPKVRCGP